MIDKVYDVMRRSLVTGMVWESRIGIVMKVSILCYFDKLEEICRLCEDIWEDKKAPSVPDQYNQRSVSVGGFQAPFATLTGEPRELPGSIDNKEGVNVRHTLITFAIIALCMFVAVFAAGCVEEDPTEPETDQWRFAVFCDTRGDNNNTSGKSGINDLVVGANCKGDCKRQLRPCSGSGRYG